MSNYDIEAERQKYVENVLKIIKNNFTVRWTNRPAEKDIWDGRVKELLSNLDILKIAVVGKHDGRLWDKGQELADRYLKHISGFYGFALVFVDDMQKMRELKENYEAVHYDCWEQGDILGKFNKRAAENGTDGVKFNKPLFARKNISGDPISFKFTETCDLLGFCCKMSADKLKDFGVEIEGGTVGEVPAIFLCEEAIASLQASLIADERAADIKAAVGQRFSVGTGNKFFDKHVTEGITLAHELSHLLMGHQENGIEVKVNRETQANFLASIMLNSPIVSIYMQYLAYFQPAEYQRTLLLYNDFGVLDMQTALFMVLSIK